MTTPYATDAKSAFTALSPLGKAGAVVASVGAATLLWALYTVTASVLGPSPGVSTVMADATNAAKQHAEAFPAYVAQIDGRTLFVTPAPPQAVAAEPEPLPEEEPSEPPKPTRYGGPPVIAMINDTAWFKDGKRLVAGEKADGDLRVIRVVPPWEVVVEWRGVEFTVGLFERDRLVLKQDGVQSTPTAEPSLPPAAPSDAEPAEPEPDPKDQTPAAPPTDGVGDVADAPKPPADPEPATDGVSDSSQPAAEKTPPTGPAPANQGT